MEGQGRRLQGRVGSLQLDPMRHENKNLADQIKDLLDRLDDGGQSIHELDKQRRRLKVEKVELQGATGGG